MAGEHSEYFGKRGANAGDEYHELWALRRMLELVSPQTGLAAVTVEGVRAEDEQGIAGAYWDGVDAACFYGADPDSIERIELVQLKCSGSAPDKPWTVARLTHSSNKRGNNSVLARLAAAWTGMRQKQPVLAAKGAIGVKLVSNQPTAPALAAALTAPKSNPDRKALRKASRLKADDFNLFLSVLDLSECGSHSRFDLEDKVVKFLSALREGDVRSDLDTLRERVRSRMRPEGQGTTVTAELVLGWFGHVDPRIFFPSPMRILRAERLIPRQATDTVLACFAAGKTRLCLHGAGGEGKTTVLQDLAQRMPQGSELIVYDCYGAGTYLDADGYRHRAADAFQQMTNDTLVRLLLPPVLNERDADHPRRFMHKLTDAAEALRARSPDAWLVVAVDAADNAVTAAAECAPPEPAFVPAFLTLGKLPDNVRLLVSARTGRLPLLNPPATFERVRLEPFTRTESDRFAHEHFNELTDNWCELFHDASAGNPRVQKYAIDFAGGDPQRALNYLTPNKHDLAGIFAARLDEAIQKSGSEADVRKLCAALALLPRPVPLADLAAIGGITPEHARDIVEDLRPGLTLRAEAVGFADEDFEDFVRGQGADVREEMIARAADHLFARHRQDAYAATHVAALLLLADRRVDILTLLDQKPVLYPLRDPAQRSLVYRQRLRVAMHVCRDAGNAVDAALLLLDGAHALKTDEAVRRALLDNIELAASFSRERLSVLLLQDRRERPRHGAVLLQLVGLDGQEGNMIGAAANERAFAAWQDDMRAARAQKDEKQKFAGQAWKLAADDVAAMIAGLLHLRGGEDGYALVKRAQPAAFRRDIMIRVVERLMRGGHYDLVREFQASLPARHPARSLIEIYLGLAGEPSDVAALGAVLARHLPGQTLNLQELGYKYDAAETPFSRYELQLAAIDLLLLRGGDRSAVRAMLAPYMVDMVRTLEMLQRTSSHGSDLAARVFALDRVLAGEQVSFDAFLSEQPPAKSEKAGDDANRRNQDWESRIGKARSVFVPLLALYATRAEIIAGVIPPHAAAERISEAVAKLRQERRNSYHRHDSRQHDNSAIRALLPLGIFPSIAAADFFAVVVPEAVAESLPDTSFLDLLRATALLPGMKQPVTTWATAAADRLSGARMGASEKLQGLIDLTKLLLPFARSAAAYCFGAALSAADDVDEDTLHAVEVALPLARRADRVLNAEKRHSVAEALAVVGHDAAIRVGASEVFPWDELGAALARLNLPVALALSARMEESGLSAPGELLESAIGEWTGGDGSLPVGVAAFLPILAEKGASLAERMVYAADPELAEIAARQVLLQPLALSDAALAKAAATDGGPWVKAVAQRCALMPVAESRGRDGPRFAATTCPSPVELEALACIDSPQSFLAAVDDIAAVDPRARKSRSQAAEEILANVPNFRACAFLDIISELPDDDYLAHDLGEWLSALLNRWQTIVAVRTWARTSLIKVIGYRLPFLVAQPYARRSHLSELLKATGLPDAEIAAHLLEAIERHIAELSVRSVSALVGLLGGYLSQDDAADLLERHVRHMLDRVEPADRSLPGFAGMPTAEEEAIARFLFAELGNIEVARRWQAAHALRLLARTREASLLARVVGEYERTAEPVFAHPTAPFYFLAARLWLMLALARIAWETPSIAAPHADWLLEQAERRDFPHLLVRHAAQNGLRGLVAAGHITDLAVLDRIEAINRSPLPYASSSRQSHEKGFDRHRFERGERRFRFDVMDTLPYWYTPMLRGFADPDNQAFLDRCEHWILDRWGGGPDTWERDKLRGRRRFERRGRDRTSTSHGTLPAIERYHHYLEWHAMFAAGGEILETWPLTDPKEEGSWDSFAGWLGGQGLTMPPLWLADLRGPKPMLPIFWDEPEATAEWLAAPNIDELVYWLGLDRQGTVTISSHVSAHGREASLSVRIESALVSRANATALRLSLEASRSSFDYRLAVNSSEDDDISDGRFVMRSLLIDYQHDTVLDRHDDLRGEVRAPPQMPHPRIVEVLALARDPARWLVWRDADKEAALIGEAWSDPTAEEEAPRRWHAQGDSLQMTRASLVRLLELEGLDLVVNLTVTRRIGEDRYGRDDKAKRREYDYVLIYRNDGAIEARCGDLGRWKEG